MRLSTLKTGLLLFLITSCAPQQQGDQLISVHLQDRNGLSETISAPERLQLWAERDPLSSQPYQKVLRMYKIAGQTCSKISSYHPNGAIWQYLESQEMRAHGPFREWFPNGQLKLEATVIGGMADLTPAAQSSWLFDGECSVWDETGRLLSTMLYQKGVLEGTSLYYTPSGALQKQLPYHQNELDGEALSYWPSGAIHTKSVYVHGVKEGLSLGFWPDGTPCWIEEYSHDSLQSGAYYDRNGKECADVYQGSGYQALFDKEALYQLVEIRNGRPEGTIRTFTPRGELLTSYSMKQGKKEGEEIEYFLPYEGAAPETPKLSVQWSGDLIHGLAKTWYLNGTLRSQSEWAHNQKSGSSCAWYRDGSLMLIEEYLDGLLESGKYFRRSQKEPISTVSHGNGLATLYNEEGVFSRRVPYSKGKPAESAEE